MELHQFFLMLAVLLLAARFLSEASARLGIPPVIGELAAGLIIGPSLLGWVTPDTTLKILAEIGIILLLFEVGMDTDVFRLAKTGAKPFIVALAGVALPLGLGFAASFYVFDLSLQSVKAMQPRVYLLASCKMAIPAGLGTLAMMVTPPPVTPPATTAYLESSDSPSTKEPM